MNNYKILENRASLTPEQIMAGMDFNAIKSHKAGVVKTLIKANALKIAAALIVVATSGVLIYNNYKSLSFSKKLLIKNDSMLVERHIPVAYQRNDSVNTVITSTIPFSHKKDFLQIKSVQKPLANDTPKKLISELPLTTVTHEQVDSLNPIKHVLVQQKPDADFKASPNAKFELWKFKSLCDPPADVKSPDITINCDDCDFDNVNCKKITANNWKAVRVTVSTDKTSRFRIETGFKNIILITANGSKIYPSYLSLGLSPNNNVNFYYGPKFVAKKLTVRFGEQMDIFLLFSEANVGDKIIIKDFVKGVIQE